MTATLDRTELSTEQLTRAQNSFLAALPKMRAVFHHYLHHRDSSTQDDLHANAEAIAWKTWLRKIEKGDDPSGYVTVIAKRAVQATWAGRMVQGMRSKDALSPTARRLHGFKLEPLHQALHREALNRPGGQECADEADGYLADLRASPADQAAFNLDWAAFKETLPEKQRLMAEEFINGERTEDVAEKFGVSAGRASQVRREIVERWHAYQGEQGAIRQFSR